MIFLMETKCDRTRLEEVSKILKFDACLAVESRGSSGGLTLMWNNKEDVVIYNYSRWHINAQASNNINTQSWLFTGFYGHPVTSKRNSSWQFLKSLKPTNSSPWFCCGDFNEITCQNEKMGGPPRPYKQMETFRSALDWCSLNQVMTFGPKYTWTNNRRGQNFTKELLDRALANPIWLTSPTEIKEKMKRLSVLQEEDRGDQIDSILKLQSEIERHLVEEDLKWKQRAKQHWLKVGDKNTRFYHLHASQRRKTNRISQILDERGLPANEKQHIGSIFSNFFHKLFTTSNPFGIADCLENMPQKVTYKMNEYLGKEYIEVEIKAAIFRMNGLGSPGPDGYPASFYQTNWDLVGRKVSTYALNILNNGGTIEGVNDTYITLIPKIKESKKVTDFRPISLCNVLYKIVAKVISNKLKTVLPNIISPSQTAFVPGRIISDNIVVAYEVLHSMTTRMQGKEGYMAFKLDMSKTYNRVEWEFLTSVMAKLGFNNSLIDLITRCTSSVSYSILLNGEPQPFFKPTRGLRQGDPLSPYLFILCTEALSWSLHKVEKKRSISSVPMGKGPTRISHLFFVDDSLIFCKANSLEWSRLMGILNQYECASGQVLNKEKSSIYFSKNTPEEKNKRAILQIAGVKAIGTYERYLGLPSMVGRKKSAAFHGLINRIWARVTNWKTNCLSIAGKEEMVDIIKSIPISLGNRQDRLGWGGTPNGKFTVKSAYHVHRALQTNLEGASSCNTPQESYWKTIWKMGVPNGVRMFLWRAYNEALPTLNNLFRRKIYESSLCPICQLEEDVCGHVKQPKMFGAKLVDRHPNFVIYKAISDLRLFKATKPINLEEIPTRNTEVAKWRKPTKGKYKLNWDASINDSRGLIGIGAIIRDSYGRVLGTLRARRNMKLSPFAAEAYALMTTVLFSKEAGLSEVHLEGDSLQVVEKLKKPAED
ncbi:uncharacterized protein LOC122316282 [Carya illinoinensis]|uniref:uncharacterized protein LOC122316282 n=1 Tax=Carya illinoinensis TaxID=32201 RepID=UPI001C71872E|nr:uncharacterized protein LOC122316282 [Carya illinoinensis]